MKFFNIITAITTACLLCMGGAYGEDKDTMVSQANGVCRTASSWVFETSDTPFEEQSEESAPPLSGPIQKAKNSCTYQKADGTMGTFYYKITFKPDKITDPKIQKKFGVSEHPYIEMNDDVMEDKFWSKKMFPSDEEWAWQLERFKEMNRRHEEQHAVDFKRWPIIGNGKLGAMEKLYGHLGGILPDAPEALKADYQRSQDLIKQMKKLENEIRNVMEARAVHAEFCAHYDMIIQYMCTERKYVPLLYYEKFTFMRFYEYKNDIFRIFHLDKLRVEPEVSRYGATQLARRVVGHDISGPFSPHGKSKILYSHSDTGVKEYTYIDAYVTYFTEKFEGGKLNGGLKKHLAAKIVKGSVAYINNPEKPDYSYKELDRLQQEYSDCMGELVAMYVKWKYYENAMPKSGYSISMADINWSSLTTNWAVPAVIDTLDYAERLIAILPQVDESIKEDDTNDDDLTDPIGIKFTELLKAKKRLFILESAKKPTEQELNEYEKRLLRAQGTIFHHIANWVSSGALSSDELDILVQVTINAPGFLAPPKPSFIETMRKEGIEDDKKRNRPTNRPGSLAEYYSALGDLCEFMSTCNAEERKALTEPALFSLGGMSSNKTVANIKKFVNESRQKRQNQSKKNSSRR